jgi:hypothetical protein
MVVTRKGFTQVVANAYAGLGFPSDGPSVYEFPMGMFDRGSDLSPINENIDRVIYGLTKWQPKITTKGIFHSDMIKVQGRNYQDAVNNMTLLFVRNMWSDGLPFVPPTRERVDWILTGTDLPPDTVIAQAVPARGGIADVTTVAVALAMAGGRPEYLPVLIGAVQVMTDPGWGLSSINPTTCSVIPAVVVNGPVAKQIRLSSGYGLLGPDPQRPAGQAIGRAIRIIQENLGGAIPGIGTMSIFGGMRATNAVFAEDEEGLPKGWNSLSVEQGYAKNANVVSATAVNGMINILWKFGTQEVNDHTLTLTAKVMGVPNDNNWGSTSAKAWNDPKHTTGIVLLPRAYAASLASTNGYSKMDVKTFLWEKSKLPWSQALETGLSDTAAHLGLEGKSMPLAPDPKQVLLVVAGGDQSGHGYYMPMGNANRLLMSKEVKLPAGWDALIKQAESDMGPIPQ